MNGSRVKVRGTGRASGPPDHGRVTVTVSAVGPTNEEAFEEVAVRSRIFEALLANLGIPDEAVRSDLSVRDRYNRDEGPQVEASNTLHVTVPDEETTAKLVTVAVREAGAQVSGPSWELEPGSSLQREAIRKAAEDARTKAEAHAEAMGVTLGPVLEIRDWEPGYSPDHERLARFTVAASASEIEPALRVYEGLIEVDATIEVTFALKADKGS